MNEQETVLNGEVIRETAANPVRDSLTGLIGSREAVEREINRRLDKRYPGDCFALFVIDLDNFRELNERFGQQAGDYILSLAAKQLSEMFYAADIVARIGGDEFLVFMSGKFTKSVLQSKAQRICDKLLFSSEAVSDPNITCSVGICFGADGEQSFENYYRIAEYSMREVKKTGKRGYCIKSKENPGYESAIPGDRAINIVQINALLESTDSGVAMVEISRLAQVIYVSPVLSRMMECAPKELIGRSALDFIHPDDRAKIEAGIKARTEGSNDSASYVVRALTNNGSEMWWRVYSVRVPDNSGKPVLLLTVTDITDLKQREANLQMDNFLFQSVLEQTTQGIWEIELSTHMFRMISGSDRFADSLSRPTVFPEELLSSGWISDESGENLRAFAREIFEGNSQGYGIFKIKNSKTKLYEWAAFSYKTIFSNEIPTKIIGIIESMETADTEVINSVKRTSLPNNLMESVVLQASGNVTTNTLFGCYAEGKELTGSSGMNGCSEFFDSELERIYLREEVGLLTRLLSRDSMTRLYGNQGNTWLTQEYRRVDSAGNIQWVSCVLNVFGSKDTNEVMFSMWQSRIDNRRRWENTFNVPVYKEPISRLYTALTVRELAGRLMAAKTEKLCAVVVIKIAGLEKFYSTEPKSANKEWSALITALMLSLGTDCVPGQLDPTRLVVFVPEIPGKRLLKKRIVQAFLFVRGVTSDIFREDDLHFAAGCACGYQTLSDYTQLLNRARRQCENWYNTSVDCVMFSAEGADSEPETLKEAQDDDEISVTQADIGRPLNDREQLMALQCFADMFAAQSIEKSADCVLSTIGGFYKADRVYILETVENGRIVVMPYEWTQECKRSVQNIINGSPTKSFPLISRCIQENKPIFVSRKSVGDIEREWRFAVFPMYDGKDIQSFLCVENNAEPIPDAAFVMLLTSCLQSERKKQLKMTGAANNISVFNVDLPNYKAYKDVILSYSSDVYTSLGVVAVDIPSYSFINSTQGFECGRRILWEIIQALRKNFGRAMIFRTWDAEFVAICPNNTHTTFAEKYNRLYGMLKRHYPNDVRIGQAWSDKVFSGEALTEEAKLIMRCDGKQENNLNAANLPEALSKFGSIKEMTAAGKFTVYYQPKVDMETGEIVGAEALVRGLDENSHIISPCYFLDELERSGAVRELDLFVLDSVLRTLTQWREEGLPLIPVAVNFSRVTLFDPRVPASVIALQSRYPEFPPGTIEIEITEGALDVNREAMVDVMNSYRDMGFTFAMDDFGSKYSNLTAFTAIRFETIKLDRGLVKDIVGNRTNQLLVRDIAEICSDKRVKCIAEGVETLDQIKTLLSCGYNTAQGYYFHRPLPPELFKEKYTELMET